jgi:multiple sugar transport system permease protein
MSNLPPGVSPPLAAAYRPPRRQERWPQNWADIVAYGILLVGSIGFLLPILFLITGSLQSHDTAISGRLHLLPNQWDIHNYPAAAHQMHFVRALANTIFVTSLCVAGQIVSASLVGFGFAKFKFPGRDALFLIMLATLMLPAQITIVPQYLIFRDFGWVNTYWPLIVPAWLGSPYFIFLFRQTFMQTPDELIEAARLDGASWIRIYYRLMLPLCKPIITVVAIYSFLSAWNEYLAPLVYLNNPARYTLSLALASFKGEYGVARPEYLLAATTLTILPCLIIFSFAQRFIGQAVRTD